MEPSIKTDSKIKWYLNSDFKICYSPILESIKLYSKDNISERPDISSQNEEISENWDDCGKMNNRGKSSDKYLTNKINIELSESNNTQNIEWRIKSASKHEIVFSSKTSDKVVLPLIYNTYDTVLTIDVFDFSSLFQLILIN